MPVPASRLGYGARPAGRTRLVPVGEVGATTLFNRFRCRAEGCFGVLEAIDDIFNQDALPGFAWSLCR